MLSMQPDVASFVLQFMCQVAGQFIVPPQKVVIRFCQIWGTKAHLYNIYSYNIYIYIIYESHDELNITVSANKISPICWRIASLRRHYRVTGVVKVSKQKE